ncbi:DNA primase [Thermodesulfobacteriota bacterium]
MALFFPEEKISEIRNSADILDIVSETVILKKTGKNFVGLCPFHSEKTPSFTVSPQKQIFHCFGCGVGGNVFSFLMKKDGLSFPEAAKLLAARFGIEVPTRRMTPEQRRRISERENLLSINRQAMDFFRGSLLGSVQGKGAVDYLKKRGITKEIVDTFNLGYAPSQWDSLVKFFVKKRISPDLVEKAGLIISKKGGTGFYDRFRGRIVFPIFNDRDQVIGFGGRVMDESQPKYLNSPETAVYNKRRSLYGLNRAKARCRESETVYIVEGYFDLLALHQHGLTASVATLGTALTPEHIKTLRGCVGGSGRFILVYDSDQAGIKAAQRSIPVFDKAFVDAQILVLPEGYDPDSYLFEFGAEEFLRLASRAPGVMLFLMDTAEKKHGLSVEGKIRIMSDLKEPLAAVDDRMARQLYTKELAERLDVDESAVLEKIKGISVDRKAAVPANDESREQGCRFEKKIIAMMLQFPKILPEVVEREVLELYEDPTLKSIGQVILNRRDSARDSVSELINSTDDEERKQIIAALALDEEVWNYKDCIKLITNFVEIKLNHHRKVLMEKIKTAEKKNDQDLLLQLLAEKQKMAVLSDKRKMAVLKER